MPYNQLYTIASQGLSLENLRIKVIAHNIANQHALQKTNGALFKPMQVLSTAKPFEQYVDEGGIDSITLLPQQLPPSKAYEPTHPAADKEGYVTYPGVNTVDEMTTLLRASNAYEANIKLMNAAHRLYLKALSIGEDK